MKKLYLLLATLLLSGGLTRAFSQDSTACNPNFTTTTSGNVVNFFPSDSTPGVLHQWNFGDSTQLATDSVDVSHRYPGAGTYLVTQTVIDSPNHCRQTSSQIVTIVSDSTPVCGVTISESIDSALRQYTFVANVTLGSGAGAPDSVAWTANDTPAGSGSTFVRSFSSGPATVCAFLTTTGGCQSHTCVTVNPDSVGVPPPPPDTCTIAITAMSNPHRSNRYVFSVVDAERYDSVTWTVTGPDSLFAGPYRRSTLAYTFPDSGYYDVRVTASARPGCAVSNGAIVHIDSIPGQSGQFISVYPNPATSEVTVTITLPAYTTLDIRVANTMGVVVAARRVSGVSGVNRVTIPVSNLPTGIYYLQLRYGSTILETNFQKR